MLIGIAMTLQKVIANKVKQSSNPKTRNHNIPLKILFRISQVSYLTRILDKSNNFRLPVIQVNRIFSYIKKHRVKSILIVSLLIAYYFCLPKQLFNDPTSTVIETEDGQLLGAQIAEDGQWRFPKSDSIPEKFRQCIIHFEDEYFYRHPGFNPISIAKALRENVRAGKNGSRGKYPHPADDPAFQEREKENLF